MIKHRVFPFIMLSLLIGKYAPSHAAALGQTVAEMASNCAVFRTVDLRAEEFAFKDDDFRTGVCWGSFLFFFYIGNLVDGTKQSPLHICLPPGTQVATFIRVFIDYADKHPQYAREPFGITAQVALMKAFSCPGDGITGSR